MQKFPYRKYLPHFGLIMVVGHENGCIMIVDPVFPNANPLPVPIDVIDYDYDRQDWAKGKYGLFYETNDHNFLCVGSSDNAEEAIDMMARFEKTFGVYLEAM